jgi:hypothetical protein
MNSTDRNSFSKTDVEITVRILNKNFQEALKTDDDLKTRDFVENQIVTFDSGAYG